MLQQKPQEQDNLSTALQVFRHPEEGSHMSLDKVQGRLGFSIATVAQNKGNCLIVCLDANEDINKKSLGKSLINIDGLSMKEVVGESSPTLQLGQHSSGDRS
jgi:hypothetical protein